jgi:hypothetical protein
MEASASVSVRVFGRPVEADQHAGGLYPEPFAPAGFLATLLFETFRLDAVARHRMYVV